MRKYLWNLPYLLLLIVVGCAALGIATPKTFNQRVAVAQAGTLAIVSDTTILLQTKKITNNDAVNVVKQTDNIMEAIDIARMLNSTNPDAAEAKLTATITVLTALQTYLATKKGN